MNKYLVTEVEGLVNNEAMEFNAWDGSYYKIVPNMENKTVVVARVIMTFWVNYMTAILRISVSGRFIKKRMAFFR